MEFHPCGICGDHVLETDEAVQCDGPCSLWHHRLCLGMTLAEYIKLSKGHEDWFCRKCIVKQEIKQESEVERRRQERQESQKSKMGKTKMECKKLDELEGDQKCVFCHKTDLDEMKYGPIYMHKNIITHYYCLLLSSNMEQNGRDSDGILGFLANDIHKEVKRGVRLYCTYCRRGGATLGCVVAKCKVVFHLPCGMEHGTLHQFFGGFKSFCAKHRPVQKISEKILAEARRDTKCSICLEKVIPRPIHETLWAPCCQKSAFFHRDCLQKLATSAGYFFKCPLCNNTNTFQKEMKEFGIYIPEQDASWECVPNAYQDLLVRHDTCDSASCSCPSGRKTNNQGTRWELILCKFCGSQGIHIGCGRLKWKSPEFVCDRCSGISEREEQANSRNDGGNRHRLTGTGREREVSPLAFDDRGDEGSDDESSDESAELVMTNRRGRSRVISPLPKSESPLPCDTRPPKKLEKHRTKRSASPKITKTEDTVVIEDSDDDIEVVSESKGESCLKTNDGATIPIVPIVSDIARKRPNVVGDINVTDVVDITNLKDEAPKKKCPTPHVEEIIYSLPSFTSKPSTSTSFCQPSTSCTSLPLDLTKFVIVDPSTFRPEDLPPGTVLYRSFTPMMQVPQMGTPVQPPVQQIPTTQVPMPQLGGTGGRSPDAKYPDLSKHWRRGSVHLNSSASHAKKTSRSNQRNSCGRRGRRRRDHDRLIPRVLLSPLKFRISRDGYFEILVPRKNLGFGFSSGSLKRKASPLPTRPAKKIKVSSRDPVVKTKSKDSAVKKKSKDSVVEKKSKDSVVEKKSKDSVVEKKSKYSVLKKKKENVEKSSSHNKEKPKKRKEKTFEKTSKRKSGDKKPKVSHAVEAKQKITEGKGKSHFKVQLASFFKTNKSDQQKKKMLSASQPNKLKKKEHSPPKNKQNKKKGLELGKWKKIDEYLNRCNSTPVKISKDSLKNTNLDNEENKGTLTVKEILDNIIDSVIKTNLSTDPSNTWSDHSNASSLDLSTEIDVHVQNSNSTTTETEQLKNRSEKTNCSSHNISNEISICSEKNSLLVAGDLFKDGVNEESTRNGRHITNKLPASENSYSFAEVETNNSVCLTPEINMNHESFTLVSSHIGSSDEASDDHITNRLSGSEDSCNFMNDEQIVLKTISPILKTQSELPILVSFHMADDDGCEISDNTNISFAPYNKLKEEVFEPKYNKIVYNRGELALGSMTSSIKEEEKVETSNPVYLTPKLTMNHESLSLVSSHIGSSDEAICCGSSEEKLNLVLTSEQVFGHNGNSANSLAKKTNEESRLCTYDPHSNSLEIDKPVEPENNVPNIISNLDSKKSAIKPSVLFPKIKIKMSWETKKGNSLDVKKRKSSCVPKKLEGKRRKHFTEKPESKDICKDILTQKSKRRKLEKANPIFKVGTLERYFSSIHRDYSCSPSKTFENSIENNCNLGKEQTNYLPSSSVDEKLGINNVHILSTEKMPLMEIKLENNHK